MVLKGAFPVLEQSILGKTGNFHNYYFCFSNVIYNVAAFYFLFYFQGTFPLSMLPL